MNLFALNCPNCGSRLEIEDGIDTFFCQYCGHKIILENRSRAAINAKVRIKHMEHEERLADKEYEHERYKMEAKKKEDKHISFVFCFFFVISLLILGIFSLSGESGVAKQEEKLQAIVNDIMIDIENGDYAEAYVKANSLYWDSSYSSSGKKKWDATRKEVIKQIREAEKANKKDVSTEDEGGNWFTNLFN